MALDVFRVDHSVRADAAGEPDREPAAAGAEISDDDSLAYPQCVHDLVRALPLVAVGTFQFPEVLRPEQPRVLRRRRGGRDQQDEPDGCEEAPAILCVVHRSSVPEHPGMSWLRPTIWHRDGPRAAGRARGRAHGSSALFVLTPWRCPRSR